MGFIYGYVWMEPTMAALEQIAPAKVGCKQDMIFVQHNRAAMSPPAEYQRSMNQPDSAHAHSKVCRISAASSPVK